MSDSEYNMGHGTEARIEALRQKVAAMTPGTPFHTSAAQALTAAEAQLKLDTVPGKTRYETRGNA